LNGQIYVLGDIHGQLPKVARLLQGAGLIDKQGHWSGGTAQLWFTGDFFDRGPYGLDAVTFVIGLQREAGDAGGQVDAVLGNHDLLVLGASRFGGGFLKNHQRNGGRKEDLAGLTDVQRAWLVKRPAMVSEGQLLIVHSDTEKYLKYGRTVSQVNRRIEQILEAADAATWDDLLHDLSERHAFDATTDRGASRLTTFLATYGARRLIHGHTPIPYVGDVPPEDVTEPFRYADGRAVNVDAGLYLGSPGFVYSAGTI